MGTIKKRYSPKQKNIKRLKMFLKRIKDGGNKDQSINGKGC